MNLTILMLALLATTADPPVDAEMVAEVFRSYGSEYKDVQFLYEGTLTHLTGDQKSSTFQGLYAYRSDGATLIDMFLADQKAPTTRLLWSLLGDRKEDLDATPSSLPAVRDREPEVSRGTDGLLDRPWSPERLFFKYFYRCHANPVEFGLEPQGWEDIDGHRCLIVTAYRGPRPKPGRPPYIRTFVKLWLDLQRSAHPLRIEWHINGKLKVQTSITLEPLATPRGQLVWFPSEAQTHTFGGEIINGKWVELAEPHYRETYHILPYTIKFDQGLADPFFSTKKQALVTSDESQAKLKRELEAVKPVRKIKEPSDPESLKRRMDDALTRADAQATQLEASSAARASGHWSVVYRPWAILLGGVALAGLIIFLARSRR